MYKADFNEIILNDQDVMIGKKYLDKIFHNNEYRILGGRVKFEGYSEDRIPEFSQFEKIKDIFHMNRFSGSGLRLCLGVAKIIVDLISKEQKCKNI